MQVNQRFDLPKLKRAEREGSSVLDVHWLRDADGFFRLPVDPIYLAEVMGLKVFRADLDDDVSGMLIKKAWRDPEIYANRRDSPTRQRFTFAHELGHYVLRTYDPESAANDSWSYTDKRDTASTTGRLPHERFANQFAAELLMPRDEVVHHVSGGCPTISSLANAFDVSPGAMGFRLANLGIQLD